MSKLMPRKQVPPLSVETVGGDRWTLADRTPRSFSMIVFYRGLHCPICKGYLGDLNKRAAEFEAKGVDVVAISTDSKERAEQAKVDWGLDALTIGYGLGIDAARAWGLYVSSSRGKTSVGVEEPALFAEPGLFLVQPNGLLYFGSVQTMPFARPNFGEVAFAIDFVLAKDYPARGEVE